MNDNTATNVEDTTENAISDKESVSETSESDDQVSEAPANVRKRIIHVKDDTDRNPGNFDWAERIWIPVGLGIIGLIATGIGTFLGFKLSEFQEANAKADRLIERASKASSDRQTVLTNYATRITDLISEEGAMEFDDNSAEKQAIWNAIRGETIIALKRLDDSRSEGQGEIDLLKDTMEDVLGLEARQTKPSSDTDSKTSQLTDLTGFDDSGELKGELVRFLYEARLLGGANSRDPEASLLRGADLTRVILSGAPLPNTNLKRAWIRWGQFDRANLKRSDLRGAELHGANFQAAILESVNLGWANLQNANLQAADLSFAILESADLRGANLRGVILTPTTTFMDACYDENTVGLENFNTQNLNMIDASKEPLDKKCSDLKPETLSKN